MSKNIRVSIRDTMKATEVGNMEPGIEQLRWINLLTMLSLAFRQLGVDLDQKMPPR